jgi:hypothetical protein
VDGAMTAGYTYNGNGQRVKKVVNGTTTIFHYSLNGQIVDYCVMSAVQPISRDVIMFQPVIATRSTKVALHSSRWTGDYPMAWEVKINR